VKKVRGPFEGKTDQNGSRDGRKVEAWKKREKGEKEEWIRKSQEKGGDEGDS
jgi:hypothetical protein